MPEQPKTDEDPRQQQKNQTAKPPQPNTTQRATSRVFHAAAGKNMQRTLGVRKLINGKSAERAETNPQTPKPNKQTNQTPNKNPTPNTQHRNMGTNRRTFRRSSKTAAPTVPTPAACLTSLNQSGNLSQGATDAASLSPNPFLPLLTGLPHIPVRCSDRLFSRTLSFFFSTRSAGQAWS